MYEATKRKRDVRKYGQLKSRGLGKSVICVWVCETG